MNRQPSIILALALGLAFFAGIRSAVSEKEVQRNNRAKEINANVAKGIDLLDRHFRAEAKPLNDVMDLAPSLRQHNWSNGSGSCVHASTISLLRWQGLNKEADEWRKRYGGGESPGPHAHKMADMGLKYVMTTDGDWSLIEWAVATRRGCGVGYGPMHCQNLVGFDGDSVVLMDNNHPDHFDRVPKADFRSRWKSLGGWAFAIVGNPPPPVPQ